MRRHWLAPFVVPLFVASCSTRTLDLGSRLDGTWSGSFDGFTFPSGTNAIVLSLALDPNGVDVTGTMTMGADTPPPQVQDKDRGYPPGYTGFPAPGTDISLYEGYRFTILGGSLYGSTLRLGIYLNELWSAWCFVQTSFAGAHLGQFECVRDWKFVRGQSGDCLLINPITDQPVPIDCGKLTLCTDNVCTCTEGRCGLPASPPQDVTLTVTLAGAHLDGKATGINLQDIVQTPNTVALAVHLVRQ